VVFAQLEIVDLVGGDDEEQGAQGHLAGADEPAEGEGAGRVGVGADDSARPAVIGLVALRVLGAGQGLPGIAGALEGQADLGRERLGEAEQGFHGASPPSVGGVVGCG
jgi:hypothetical protein